MKRANFFLENLKGKILDVGFSSGTMHENVLEKFGKETVYGIDILFHKKHVGNYAEGSAEDMPYSDNSFDSILAGELIEHLENPEKFVKEAYRILTKGGVLVLSTPNKKSLINRVFHSYEMPLHLHLFYREELQNLFEKEGFKVKIFKCLPFTSESCDGSKAPQFLFFFRNLTHYLLPNSLREDMLFVVEK